MSTSQALTPRNVFILTFAFVFVLTFFLGLVIVGSFGWLLGLLGISSTQLYLIVAVAATFTGLIFGFLGLLMYYVWRAVPKGVQVVLIVVLFAVGLSLAQPDIDVLAVVGVILTLGGVNNGMKRLPA